MTVGDCARGPRPAVAVLPAEPAQPMHVLIYSDGTVAESRIVDGGPADEDENIAAADSIVIRAIRAGELGPELGLDRRTP